MNFRKSVEFTGSFFSVSWFVAWLFRWQLTMGRFGFLLWFIAPGVLAMVFIGFTIHYFNRVFTVGQRSARLAKSIGLAAVSTTLAVPLSGFISRSLWAPYNYGPGP